MRILKPGRRPISPESRAGLGAAFVLLAVVAAVELADGDRPHYIGLFAAAPFLAAAFATWRDVVVVGGVATALGVGFAAYPDGIGMASGINIAGVVVATGIAAVVGNVRVRQAARLAELSRLASVAQGAVLRPLG
ncbi:MAG: serine/threonine-protein phosphatase, partial [Micromonosporaceae bacterium]|nr:serine/threonine-protein phosphatase [Micromonosporaceae bacterium]